MSYLSPIFSKNAKNWEGKAKHRYTASYNVNLANSPHYNYCATLYTVRAKATGTSSTCFSTLTHFAQVLQSVIKQIWKILHNISSVDFYPQINNGKRIPSMKLQAVEDLQ